MAGDYRVGGMEDYRRIEMNPAVNTVGLASVAVADSDVSDKARADRLREEFRRDMARGGNREHSEIRANALSRSLLSAEQVRANEALVCGMSPEARRQLGFTILLIIVSLNYTFMSTLEQRFVGHIGKDAMAAKSISYGMVRDSMALPRGAAPAFPLPASRFPLPASRCAPCANGVARSMRRRSSH
jgi:hypothetical protein